MRNALAHAGKSGRRVVSAFMATAFDRDSAEAAKAQWRDVADQLRQKLPKSSAFMDEAELNGEVKRRTEVVGIFPIDEAIFRLVGATLLEQDDEWAVQRARYITLETTAALSDDPPPRCPQWPSDQSGPARNSS